MKRFLLLSIIISFIAIFFTSSVEVKADCPTGWSYTSLQFGPDPSGCTFQVDFCFKCGMTGGDPSNLKVLNIKPLNGCIAPDKDWLVNEILKSYSEFCTVPACENGCLTTIIEFPLCMQWHTYGSLINGEYSYYSWLEACQGSGYCQITAKICRDYQTNWIVDCPNDPVKQYQTINLNCPVTPIPEPTQFNPDFVGEKVTSECFKYYTCP